MKRAIAPVRATYAALGERGVLILLSLAMIAVGCWLVWQPLALIVPGVMLFGLVTAPLMVPLFSQRRRE